MELREFSAYCIVYIHILSPRPIHFSKLWLAAGDNPPWPEYLLTMQTSSERSAPDTDPSVLFVCLGNICRSPLAEAAFRREVQIASLDIAIDSAGTGDWHVGEPPDPRACAEALRNGIDISSYRARQVTASDFHRFTLILALDEKNLADLEAIAPADGSATLSLLLDHVEGCAGQSVADPYFGEADGFAETWREVSVAAQALIRKFERTR